MLETGKIYKNTTGKQYNFFDTNFDFVRLLKIGETFVFIDFYGPYKSMFKILTEDGLIGYLQIDNCKHEKFLQQKKR